MDYMTVRKLRELLADEELDQNAAVVFQDPNVFNEIISAYQINSDANKVTADLINFHTGYDIQPGQNIVVLWGD